MLADLPLGQPWLLWVVLAVLLGGLLRGLSGFGGAMIMVPVVGAVLGPAAAVPIANMVDIVITAPLLPDAFRRCRWREVLPLFVGGALLVPVGVWLLTLLDPELLRRAISVVILVAAAAMASGWRYKRQPSHSVSFGVGALSGLLSGAAGVSGPPVVLFWLGGQAAAPTLRANLIAYFGLMDVITVGSLWLGGLFTRPVLTLSLIMMPVYGIGVWLGAHGFRLASERTFRRLSLAAVMLIAVASLFR
ncbi:MAG TPA: sulfite exporter TauE/SafE family protein [Alphaproteobacteria bacterium]|nr:sulfite exporter TauE/SafE family protein [Alphaproteobacteria bacterium]